MSPRNQLSPSPLCWDYKYVSECLAFHVNAGDRTQFFILGRQILYILTELCPYLQNNETLQCDRHILSTCHGMHYFIEKLWIFYGFHTMYPDHINLPVLSYLPSALATYPQNKIKFRRKKKNKQAWSCSMTQLIYCKCPLLLVLGGGLCSPFPVPGVFAQVGRGPLVLDELLG